MSSRNNIVIRKSPKDCMTCRRYTDCKDSRKTIGFHCSKYTRPKNHSVSFVDKLFEGETFDMPVQDELGLDMTKLELDLEGMVRDAVDPHTHMVRDLKIDDRDIKEFPNYFEFITSKSGLNMPGVFSRQAYVLLQLFGEICPKCSDPKWKTVLDVPVDMKSRDMPDHLVMLKHGKCPKCKRTKAELIKKGRINPYQELAALVGQRAGKSTMLVSPAVCYLLHRMVKLQKPYEIYGLMPTTLIGTLVAQTFANAVEQLWLPVKTYLEKSPWFESYHEMLKDYGNKYGEEFLKFQSQGIHYLHRQLMLYPAGPNRKLLRGKTRWLSAIDEWDFFDNDDDSEQIRMNGQEVYTSLGNSMLTIRNGWHRAVKRGQYNVPNAFFLTASSPQHARGVLVKHVNENQNSKEIYAIHLPTWELHPEMGRYGPTMLKEFAKDPQKAERDFGANPPLTDSAFIEDLGAIQGMTSDSLSNRVEIQYIHKPSSNGVLRAAKITAKRMPGQIEPSILSLDAGLTANSFALTVGHRNPVKNSDKKLVFDIILEITPEKGKIALSHAKIYQDLIRPIIQQFNVSVVLADRWNSVKMLQDIEDEFGITAGPYSLKYKDMQLVRNHILENTIVIPQATKKVTDIVREETGSYPECFKYRPVDHFLLQLATIKDTGKEIVKGTKLTDDIWRAFALGTVFLLNDEFCKKNLRNRIRRQISGGLVAANLLSAGGTQAYGGSGVLANPRQQRDDLTRIAASSGGYGGGLGTAMNVFARK